MHKDIYTLIYIDIWFVSFPAPLDYLMWRSVPSSGGGCLSLLTTALGRPFVENEMVNGFGGNTGPFKLLKPQQQNTKQKINPLPWMVKSKWQILNKHWKLMTKRRKHNTVPSLYHWTLYSHWFLKWLPPLTRTELPPVWMHWGAVGGRPSIHSVYSSFPVFPWKQENVGHLWFHSSFLGLVPNVPNCNLLLILEGAACAFVAAL